MQPKFVNVGNRIYQMGFQALITFANGVVAAMTAASSTFVTPSPDLADITTAADDMQIALDDWGLPGARGSRLQYTNLLSARLILRNLLEQEAGYVQNIARSTAPAYDDQKVIVLSAGMRAKDASNSLAAYGPVQAGRQLVFQRLLGTGKVHLRWKKPLVLPGANSKPPFYNVQVYTGAQLNQLLLTFQSTKTFAEIQLGSGQQGRVVINPVSAAGVGASSSSIIVLGQ